MNPERRRRAAEISGRSLDRSHDVLLLELFLREIERDAMGEELFDDLLELRVQIHVGLRRNESGVREGAHLSKRNSSRKESNTNLSLRVAITREINFRASVESSSPSDASRRRVDERTHRVARATVSETKKRRGAGRLS